MHRRIKQSYPHGPYFLVAEDIQKTINIKNTKNLIVYAKPCEKEKTEQDKGTKECC